MKRIYVIILLIVFSVFALGCTKEKEQVEEKPVSLQAVEEKETVQEVVGWQDTYHLLYVVGEDNQRLKTANLKEGTATTIAQFPGWIQSVDYHSSAQLYTVQWTGEEGGTQIDVVDTEGKFVEWLPFEGEAFDIQWHPTKPHLWLVTTFDEAWNSNVYLYDSKEKYGTYLEKAAPFAFWHLGKVTFFDEGTLTVGAESRALVGTEKEPLAFYSVQKNILGVFYANHTLFFYLWDELFEEQSAWELTTTIDEWSILPPVVRETEEGIDLFISSSPSTHKHYTVNCETGELIVEEVEKLPYDCNERYCLQSDQRTVEPEGIKWLKEEE